MQELPPLKLGQAVFQVEMTTDAQRVADEGCDTVAFVVQTNPGSRPGPMHKVASGGELSRFLLALKVVIAERSSAPTLIFDEIDTGVGGAVADAMGERLQRLGGQLQVLAITHAPQVASRARQHYVIAKSVMDGQTRTHVRSVADEERLEEVARMLSAAEVTPEARAAASQLLKTGSLS
jgi:DNA repair protein RecN (Recombination protein N)